MSLGLPASEERQRRISPRGTLVIVGLFLFSLLGATFAANITINGDNRIEFGQGIYQITSCDQFINVKLKSSNAFSDGLSRVGSIELSGLDVARCAGTSLRLRMYDSSNPAPLDIFTNVAYTFRSTSYPCCTETGTAVVMVIASDAQQATAGDSITLISPSGKSIGYGDRHQSIGYDPDSGVFSVSFMSPLAIMRDVANTTFESASNA